MYGSVLSEHVVSVLSAIDSLVLSRVHFGGIRRSGRALRATHPPCELQLRRRLFHLAQVRVVLFDVGPAECRANGSVRRHEIDDRGDTGAPLLRAVGRVLLPHLVGVVARDRPDVLGLHVSRSRQVVVGSPHPSLRKLEVHADLFGDPGEGLGQGGHAAEIGTLCSGEQQVLLALQLPLIELRIAVTVSRAAPCAACPVSEGLGTERLRTH
jgi:hypothetical protein